MPHPLYGLYERRLLASLPRERMPRHVGVILDGNRRWARSIGLDPTTGHQRGADKISEVLGWCEEVGVEARIAGFVRHVEPIQREGERVKAHFVIAVFKGLWLAGEPKTGEEVSEIAWVDPLALGDRPTTPELADILARAAAL